MTRSESNQQWWDSLGTGHKRGGRYRKGSVQNCAPIASGTGKKSKRLNYEDVRKMSGEELRRACKC